ncbi:MAG: hypothetical protein LQ352_007478 [Teloschistes flavicans]|nr:MAG: hypothetical protein LQ352_007478 [Teloschistes flavicans]
MSPSNSASRGTQDKMRSSESPFRLRPLGRASTLAEASHPLRHRRSSTFSDSVDDAKNSIKSSTDDLLLPRANGPNLASQLEPSHWHSTPLALALLPALGGVLFQNGSAVVTDITLLGLAAIFLNWSVRLPWEWYHSAQRTQPEDRPTHKQDWSDDTIIEEEEDEHALDHDSRNADPVNHPARQRPLNEAQSQEQASAAKELRIHELLALFACFLSPILGGWLLHATRSQLSRPSEGLVSNYNLTVFLLASEVRPLSHLIKMIQARTLYLQRTVGADAYDKPPADRNSVTNMGQRISELEAYVAQPDTSATAAAGDQIKREVRNSLQPDLDALNRAVRRYEKKFVALTMQTESRLQELEARMSDAITLAAAAERSSNQQRSRRGSSVLVVYEWVSAGLLLPVRTAWAAISLPAMLLNAIVTRMEQHIGGKVRREMKTAGRASGGHSRRSTAGSTKVKKAM